MQFGFAARRFSGAVLQQAFEVRVTTLHREHRYPVSPGPEQEKPWIIREFFCTMEALSNIDERRHTRSC